MTFRIDQDVMSQYHTTPKCQCVNKTKTRFFLKGHVHHGLAAGLCFTQSLGIPGREGPTIMELHGLE